MPRLLNHVAMLLSRPFRPRRTTVLTLLNDARAALGEAPLRDLPAGRAACASACPIATALDAFVGVDAVCFHEIHRAACVARAWGVRLSAQRGLYHVPLPPALRRFVLHLDMGAFPALTLPFASTDACVPGTPTL